MKRFVLAGVRFLLQFIDEATVLHCDTGVLGERLQEPAIIVLERRDIAQTIADNDRADHVAIVAKPRHHQLFAVMLQQQRTRPLILRAAPHQDAATISVALAPTATPRHRNARPSVRS